MQSNNLKLYYCHPCQKSVMINFPNLICPDCGSDFLQEANMPKIEPESLPESPFPNMLSIFSENQELASRRHQLMGRILQEITQNSSNSLRNIQDLLHELIHRSEQMGPASETMLSNIKSTEISASEPNDCKICAYNFESGEIKQTLPCEHEFHLACLSPWLKLKSFCPVCKHSL